MTHEHHCEYCGAEISCEWLNARLEDFGPCKQDDWYICERCGEVEREIFERDAENARCGDTV